MNIPLFIYKIFAPIISPTVLMLFNNSVSEGIFAECFKTAKIIPIFKSGDSNSTVNYWPISMLPFLSKIFEKLMWARLDSYLKSNNILCTNQFGLRKNSNTSDAIIELLDYVYSSLDSKQSTIALYLDFSKAFDTVNHNILMSLMIIDEHIDEFDDYWWTYWWVLMVGTQALYRQVGNSHNCSATTVAVVGNSHNCGRWTATTVQKTTQKQNKNKTKTKAPA